MDEHAVLQSLKLLSAVQAKGKQTPSERAQKRAWLLEYLPSMMETLVSEGMSNERRMEKMERLGDAIARIDPLDEAMLFDKLRELGLLYVVISCLERTPISEERLLVAGMVLLKNATGLSRGVELVIDAGAAPLISRLLCGLSGESSTAAPLPSPDVQRFAVAALAGLVHEQRGREAVPLSVRGPLMAKLNALQHDAASHRHASSALKSLRRLRQRRGAEAEAPGAAQPYASAPAFAQRQARAAAVAAVERRQEQLDAIERARIAAGVVRHRAASKLQAAFRTRRDARIGAHKLRVQKSALAFIGATWRGRQRNMAIRFGSKLRQRAQASLAARIARASADLPAEEAELLLNLFGTEGAEGDGKELSEAEKRKRRRKARREARAAFFRTICCGDNFLFRAVSSCCGCIGRFCKAMVSIETYVPEVCRWTLAWTVKHHPTSFWRNVVFICYSSLFLGAIPVMMNYLFTTALPNAQNGYDCNADIILMIGLIILGNVSVIQVKYYLAISKMDGAGFVPPFQEELTKHLCRVEQTSRDEFNETELITVIEKDAQTLNKVILANFDMLESILKLIILVPSLAFLSGELTILVVTAIPIFVAIQLRQGVQIVAAARELRGAEFKFMRAIEESLVFTISRKVLGIGYALDNTIKAGQFDLVKKFEKLDRREAKSSRQLMAFNLLYKCARSFLASY